MGRSQRCCPELRIDPTAKDYAAAGVNSAKSSGIRAASGGGFGIGIWEPLKAAIGGSLEETARGVTGDILSGPEPPSTQDHQAPRTVPFQGALT